MFIMGGLSGVMHASPPADLQQTDTYFIVAHFHYVLFGGCIFGADRRAPTTGGPKMSGKMLDERLGKLHFWLMLHRLQHDLLPDALPGAERHAAAGLHLPGRSSTSDSGTRSRPSARCILGLSFLVFLVNICQDLARASTPAPADPWNGATLEWSIPSPPQEFNFAEVPQVHGRDALWEAKRPRAAALPEPQRVSGKGIHMPNPSYWPLVAAMGVAVTLVGFIGVAPAGASLVGVAILFFGVYQLGVRAGG